MRGLLFSIIFLVVPFTSSAQHGLLLGYSNTHIGANVACEYFRSIGRFQIEVGIKYHLFNPDYGHENSVFQDRVYPRKWIHHFGPVVGVNRRFSIHSISLRPEIFIQTQLTYAGLYNVFYTRTRCVPNGPVYYIREVVIFEEQFSLENILGIGFDLPITSNLRFYNRYGVGIDCFWGVDKQLDVAHTGKLIYEFGLFYSLGLTYTFSMKDVD